MTLKRDESAFDDKTVGPDPDTAPSDDVSRDGDGVQGDRHGMPNADDHERAAGDSGWGRAHLRNRDESLSDANTFVGPQPRAQAPQTDASQRGLVAGRYEIVEECGRGAMGVVYLARDVALGRDLAIKRLSEDVAGSAKGIARFLNEAQSIAHLNHQNIVHIYDVGQDERGHYIVMEWVGGGTLADRIKEKGPLDLDEATQLMRGLCNAMSYAHRLSVIHRDLKPSNILLTGDLLPKIADFGLARMGRDSNLSQDGYGMGTPGYMSPEQRRNARSADHRSDIYALGTTLYEMVTGQSPEVMDMEELSGSLRAIVKRATRTNPEDRFFSVDELWAAIEASQSSSVMAGPGPDEVVAATAGVGVCPNPECGFANPADERYCQNCGTGLFEACPNCGHEQYIGRKHCGNCGVSIEDFKEYLDFVTTAEKYLGDGRFSRAIKEADSALGKMPRDERAMRVRRDAESRSVKFNELRNQAEDATSEHRFDDAERMLKEALKLKPGHAKVEEQLIRLPDLRRDAEILALRRAISDALEAGELDAAEEAIEKGLELAPGDDGFVDARVRLARTRVDAELEDLRKRTQERLAEERFDEAEDAARHALDLKPGLSEFEELLAKIESRREAHELRSLRREMQASLGDLYYKQAKDCATRVLRKVPDDNDARSVLDAAEGKLEEVARIKASVGEAVEAGLFQEAGRLLTRAAAEFPHDADFAGQLERLPEIVGERELTSLRAHMSRAFSKGKYSIAGRLAASILEKDPSDFVAKKVQSETRWLSRELRRRRTWRTVAVVFAAAVIALTWSISVPRGSGSGHSYGSSSGVFGLMKTPDRPPIGGVSSCSYRVEDCAEVATYRVELWPQHRYFTKCEGVDIHKGDLFVIRSPRGVRNTYTIDEDVCWSGPEGGPPVQNMRNPDEFLHRYARFGCLLARIDEWEPLVGVSGPYTAEVDGNLYLGVNERAGEGTWRDNRTRNGRPLVFEVTVGRDHPLVVNDS